ncbi:hypothetical protein HanPSC8_Chr15g0680481 [Helianthus annuus]|nr:hypothetical protein HanPSC8_Chr15g0680481 [Helianthus annuus]
MWNQLHTKQLQNLQNSSTRTRVKCGFQVHMSSSSSSFFLLGHSPLLFLVSRNLHVHDFCIASISLKDIKLD